jgi:hypothetical protein
MWILKNQKKVLVLFTMAILLAFLLTGCSGSDPSGEVVKDHLEGYEGREPPIFNLGDEVYFRSTAPVGIVVGVYSDTYSQNEDESVETWMYEVMFQQKTIKYAENHLELYARKEWVKLDGVLDVSIQ